MTNSSRTTEEFLAAILGYLQEATRSPIHTVGPDTKMMNVIDSFGLVELLAFLEGELHCKVDLAAVTSKDLATAKSFAHFLSRPK